MALSGIIDTDLYDLSGTADDDVWAVGAGGTALHFDGSSWTRIPIATSADLRGVAARSPNDVWAVGFTSGGGSAPNVFHWDGVEWGNEVWVSSLFQGPTRVDERDTAGHSDPQGMWMSPSGTLFIVGEEGEANRRSRLCPTTP